MLERFVLTGLGRLDSVRAHVPVAELRIGRVLTVLLVVPIAIVALATGLPLLAMTSLALIAHGAAAENACAGGLAVCMDAGKGQIFAQLFQCSPRRPTLSSVDTAPICGPMLTTIGEFAALLAAGRGVGPTTVVGSAAVVVAMKATESGVDVLAADRPGLPSARHLHGADLKPFSPARPLYLRLPDAVPPVDLSLPRASP